MNNELYNLLNLDSSDKSNSSPEPDCLNLGNDDSRDSSSLKKGETIFNLDKWELEQGKRICFDLYPNRGDNDLLNDATDIFAACFRQGPEIEQDCGQPLFQQFMETLLLTPDFKVLRQSTAGSVQESDIASKEIIHKWLELKESQQKDKPHEQSAQCNKAVYQALKEASKEVEDYQETVRALGAGSEPGQDNKIPTDETVKMFNKVKKSHKLKRIMDLAGRYRRVAQAKQRQKTSHGYDDMVGVEMAGDVARLLPVELVKLSEPLMELDAMRRLVEKQSMCREYRGIERVGKGPIVICVDESGSMSGNKIEQAKAFALAMYWIAKHQNRDCALVGFSRGVVITCTFLKRNVSNAMGILEWLEHFFAGGTDLWGPCHTVTGKEFWNNTVKGKTDFIIITDAVLHIEPELQKSFLQFKAKEQVKLITIVIGGGGESMKSISDEIFNVGGISVESDAVQKCMSI